MFLFKFLRRGKNRENINRQIRNAKSNLASLSGVPSNRGDANGFEAEAKVKKALRICKKRKFLREARQTRRFSPDDLSGVDFFVTLLNGERIMIQVKSYYTFDEEKKYREKGIKFLPIFPSDDEEMARQKVQELILDGYFSKLSPDRIKRAITYVLKMDSSVSSQNRRAR